MEQDRLENTEMESTGKAEYIVEKLKEQIQEGKLKEQKKLPSERDLSQQYGVSRMTARRALQMLEGEGLVIRRPVRGTFVKGIRERLYDDYESGRNIKFDASSRVFNELGKSGSFVKEMELLDRKPEVYWLEPLALVAASPEIAEQLQLQEDMLVLKRYRLQLADGLPYRLVESYYPADLFGELLTIDIGDKPLFDWLQERHGLIVVHAKEQLIARLPTLDERRLLQISPNSPVVAFNRTVWADSGRPVEWAYIVAVAHLYAFTYEYEIPRKS